LTKGNLGFAEFEFTSPMFGGSKFNSVIAKFPVGFLVHFEGLRSGGLHGGKVFVFGTTIFDTTEACGYTTEEEKNQGGKTDPESYKCG
jgi:hypothetical protein